MSTATIDRPTAAELRNQLLEAGDRLRELRTQPADARPETWTTDARDAVSLINTLDAELTSIERSAAPEARGPQAAFDDIREAMQTAGERVTNRDEFRSWAQGGEYRDFPAVEVRTLLDSTTDGGSPGLLLNPGVPILPRPRQRRLFVRDLLTVQQTGLASVPYIRELNPATNETGATAVAEGAPKPEVVMEWEADDAPVRKIAAWIPVTMEILQDAPTLRGYIDTRLAYMLKVREEYQAINGSGTAPNIKGILTFTTQEQAAVAGDVPATIGQAIGKIENVDGSPDGVAMNPLDFWEAMTSRHATQFDGDGVTGLPYTGPPQGWWGLPTVRTRALSQGAAIVADWAMGATLFDRMQTTIRTSDSHDTYFTQNKVAILAEERVALAVHRPDFFVDTVIDTTA